MLSPPTDAKKRPDETENGGREEIPESSGCSQSCLCSDEKFLHEENPVFCDRLLRRLVNKQHGWICIAQDCDFHCDEMHKMLHHSGVHGHNPYVNGLQYEEIQDLKSINIQSKTGSESLVNNGESFEPKSKIRRLTICTLKSFTFLFF